MGYLFISLGERAAVRKAGLRTIVSAIGDDRGTPFRQPDQTWSGTRRIVKIIDLSSLCDRSGRSLDRNWLEACDRNALDIDLCINGRNPKTAEYEYFDCCGLKDFLEALENSSCRAKHADMLSVRRGQPQR